MRLPSFKHDVSLSYNLYQTLFQQIVNGKLEPGQRITEATLAQTTGTSRTPVREALKRLAEDRLVVLVPRSGCYVAQLAPDEIEEIYEIRKRLEVMALEFAFDKTDRDKVRKLRQKFGDCDSCGHDTFHKREIQLDSQLHNMLAEQSGCPNLQEMLGKLRARIEMFRVKQADLAARTRTAFEEHKAILDAILDNDKDAALTALTNHIENTKLNVLNSTLFKVARER